MKLLAILGTLLFLPLFAVAQEFVPLAPIPGLDTSDDATLASYINSVFYLLIAVAAMLAVIRIVIGGFQYMTTEAVTTKGEAVKTIREAVFGLLLLLGTWVILATVNQDIVNLEALRFTELGPSDQVQQGINESRAEAQARAERRTNWQNQLRGEGTAIEVGGINMRAWSTDVTELSPEEQISLLKVAQKQLGAGLLSKSKCEIQKGAGQSAGKTIVFCRRAE